MASETIYIGRQPILDRDEKLFAYELLFRTAGAQSAVILDDVKATARVLVNTLNNIGIDKLLAGKLGFINFNEQMLIDEVLEILPKDKFMLEILEFSEVDDALVERVKSLKEDGYQFAIDDFIFTQEMIKRFRPLFPHITLIKVDVLEMSHEKLRQNTPILKQLGVKLLAEKVEDREMFELCLELGFDYYQGYYFAKPEIVSNEGINPSKMIVAKIMNLLMSDAKPKEIEDGFKQSPDITINLLRYLNSGAIAMRSEVTSIKQAVTLLGNKKLLQWVILISYAGSSDDVANNPLMQTVQLRAKTMELLLSYSTKEYSVKLQDEAFTIGLLSLIDTLFGAKLDYLLVELNVSQVISVALLEDEGELGHLFRLQRYLEKDQFSDAISLMGDLGIEMDGMINAKIDAMHWVDDIMQSM
jgi:c-di-GMP phosphodiesterase